MNIWQQIMLYSVVITQISLIITSVMQSRKLDSHHVRINSAISTINALCTSVVEGARKNEVKQVGNVRSIRITLPDHPNNDTPPNDAA